MIILKQGERIIPPVDSVQISKEDLKWLLENTIREICIQDDEYGCKPFREDTDRILRLMGDMEVELPKEVDVRWLLDARKEVY